jgi:hypothetical protein
MIFNVVLAAAALFASAANAHISLAAPIPYGHPDTSPLTASGANYPCKTDNGFTVNTVTKMAVGESQKMSFSGSAVHGGGSCQISLTPGRTPTDSSQFKVIYSIMGGCPGTDASTVSYDFKIPAEVPAGDYTLAWTWFNRIGNREMYMNCAPITVSGGSGSDSTFSALPDMAIYNIADKNTCKTTEGTDVAFPDPGKYVLTGSGNKPGPPVGCGGAAAAAGPAAAAPAAPAAGSDGTPTGSANNGQYTGIGSSAGNAGAAAPAAPAAASSPASAASVSPQSGGSAPSYATSPALATPAIATPAVATPAVATPAVATPAVATPAASTPSSAASGGSGTFA